VGLPGTIPKNSASFSRTFYVNKTASNVPTEPIPILSTFRSTTGSQNTGSGTLAPGAIDAVTVTVNVALATVNNTITPSTLNFSRSLVAYGLYNQTSAFTVPVALAAC